MKKYPTKSSLQLINVSKRVRECASKSNKQKVEKVDEIFRIFFSSENYFRYRF